MRRDNLIFPFLIWCLLFFSCLDVVASISSTMLSKNSDRSPCQILSYRENAHSQFFMLRVVFFSFFRWSLSSWGSPLSFLISWKLLWMNFVFYWVIFLHLLIWWYGLSFLICWFAEVHWLVLEYLINFLYMKSILLDLGMQLLFYINELNILIFS